MQYAHQLDNEPANPVTVQLDLFGAPRQAMMLADHAGYATKDTLIDVEQVRLQQSIRKAIREGQLELNEGEEI